MYKYQQFPMESGMMFGYYSGAASELESAIRKLYSGVNITQVEGGPIVYQFGQHTNTNGANDGLSLFTAIVIYYDLEQMRNAHLNLEINVTSNSLVLLQEVIARIVSEAAIKVVDTVPPHLKLDGKNVNALLEQTGAPNFSNN